MVRTADIRERIVRNTFPPKFDRTLWQYREPLVNCYAYALNCCVTNHEMASFFSEVGRISNLPGMQEPIQKKDLQTRFLKDMETLELKTRRTKYNVKERDGGYKVGICISPYGDDFHFIRQEENGIWSHKFVNDVPRFLCEEKESPEPYLEYYCYEVVDYFLISF